MEPLLFQLEWDVAFEVLATVVLLAFIVERALALLFENKFYDVPFGGTGLSEIIALSTAFGVVYYCRFDALAILMGREQMSWVGYLVTAATIAGGSKGAIALFHNVLNWQSSYLKSKSELMKRGVPRKEAAAAAAAGASPPKVPDVVSTVTVVDASSATTTVVDETRVTKPR